MIKSQIIKTIQEIIYYLRVQNYHEGCMRFRALLKDMQEEEDINNALCETESELAAVISQILQALEKDDLILVADLLEEALMPVIKAMILPIEAVDKRKYRLEITSSGYLTVKHLASDLYLHSNGNPMEEARILTQLCYDPKKEKYAVWGIGLGYHIARLYEEARGSIRIVVFDEDEEMIQIAKECGVLSNIPEDRLSYVVDASGRNFAKYLSENETGILIHFPSVKKIQNKKLQEIMHNFFASWNGTIQFRTELAVNFRSNQKMCSHNVDELAESFKDKEVIIVGAGPSLDDTIDFLKMSVGNKVIVAVTTVLKKLLGLGIVPDYAVVMDSQSRTIKQIEGIEKAEVPFIIDSTAYWEFATRCTGKKYIAYQKNFKEADECANKAGYNQYETGGAVTTLALEIALRLGAKAIYLVGVDLAYPNGISHADDTMDKKKRDTLGMKKVRSVNGGWVYTDSLFDAYRKWIEEKIIKYPNVPCYNLSNCGAYIAGTVMNE